MHCNISAEKKELLKRFLVQDKNNETSSDDSKHEKRVNKIDKSSKVNNGKRSKLGNAQPSYRRATWRPPTDDLHPHYASPFLPLRCFYFADNELSRHNYKSPQSAPNWSFKTQNPKQNVPDGISQKSGACSKVGNNTATYSRMAMYRNRLGSRGTRESSYSSSDETTSNECFFRSKSRNSLCSTDYSSSNSSISLTRQRSASSRRPKRLRFPESHKNALSTTCPPRGLEDLRTKYDPIELAAARLSFLSLSSKPLDDSAKNKKDVKHPLKPFALNSFSRGGIYASLPSLPKEKRISLLFSPRPFYKSQSALVEEPQNSPKETKDEQDKSISTYCQTTDKSFQMKASKIFPDRHCQMKLRGRTQYPSEKLGLHLSLKTASKPEVNLVEDATNSNLILSNEEFSRDSILTERLCSTLNF